MNINEGYDVGILPIYPQGTNSTMFTECCETAITDSEKCCPKCGREVVGYNSDSDHDRGRVRWGYATKGWRCR